MSAATIQQMADRVAGLIEQRLGLKGPGLDLVAARATQRLPRRLRADLAKLTEAAQMAQNPKLYLQIDQEGTAAAYDRLVRHLGGVNAWSRRRGWLLDRLASIAFSLLILAALIGALLYWRDLI